MWNELATIIFDNNVNKGFWPSRDPSSRNFGEMMALCHSEITEAWEGATSAAKDDHIPSLPMFEVELADAAIRTLDILAAYKVDIDAIYGIRKARFSAMTSVDEDLMRVHACYDFALEAHRKGSSRYIEYLVDALAALDGLATKHNFALISVIEAKHIYNTQRPYKHGKAY